MLLLSFTSLVLTLMPTGCVVCRIFPVVGRSWFALAGTWLVAVSTFATALSRSGSLNDPGLSPVIDGPLRFGGIFYIAIALAVTAKFVARRLPDRDPAREGPAYLVDAPSFYWICSVAFAVLVTGLSLSPA